MSRACAITLWLIYTGSVLVFGLWPHHHGAAGQCGERDCIACAWQAANTTDPPQLTPSVTAEPRFLFIAFWPDALLQPAEFEPATAVRAPPRLAA